LSTSWTRSDGSRKCDVTRKTSAGRNGYRRRVPIGRAGQDRNRCTAHPKS
jgi:hypothetical protein